jgi:hypothetical protein
MNPDGLFQDTLFLFIGWIMLLGLMVSLVFAITNQRDNRKWVIISAALGALFIILFAVSTISTMTVSPKLEFSKPVKYNPQQGTAYVSIMIVNKGEKVAKNCVGEIIIRGLNSEPLKVVWGGEAETKNILPYEGNERLYFLVADPDKTPTRVVPYYPGVSRPPRADDPWLLKSGDYNLQLSVRSENSRPASVELGVHVGQTWEDVKCIVK